MNPLRDSWAVVAPDAGWIALVSVVQVMGALGIYPEITVPLFLVSIPVTVVLYGRVLARCAPGETNRVVEILMAHWLNWLVVSILVGLPILLVRLLLVALHPSSLVGLPLMVLVRAAVSVLTMYALPFAFLSRRSLSAVIGGLAFLRGNRSDSVWIAWLILFMVLFGSTARLLFGLTMSGGTFTLAVVAAVVTGLLGFTAFAGALRNALASYS